MNATCLTALALVVLLNPWAAQAATPASATLGAVTQASASAANTLTPDQSQQQIQTIVHSPSFSQTIETTKWQEINPKPKGQTATPGWWDRFWRWVADTFGGSDRAMANGVSWLAMGVKLALLLALMGVAVWLYQQRDRWLNWFAKARRQARSPHVAVISPQISRHDAPLWQGLPAREQLVAAIEQALRAQQWRQALSYLYRGTLREILQVHELPITQATTEVQCRWLLQQAPTRQPDEARYFTDLVAVWSQVAYGQRMPAAQMSNQSSSQSPGQKTDEFRQRVWQLTQDWQRLYLDAPKRPTQSAALFANATQPRAAS